MSTRAWVGATLVLAFIVRLVSIRLLTVPAPVIDADANWYHASATLMAEGLGYIHHFTRLPTAEWPPGYPAILAAVYRLLGPDPAWAYVLNAVAGTATCWLAGLLARRLGSDREQIAATALVALLPSHVLFTTLVMSETVFTTMMTALLLGALVLVERAGPSVAWRGWIAWGAAAGAASLVRAEAVVVLAAPLAVLAASRVPVRRIAAVAAVAAAAMLVVELPWLVRNARLFGRVVPVSTSFGRTFLIGHNPVAEGDMNLWSPDPEADRRDRLAGHPALDLAVDNRLRDAGLRYMIEHPGREVVLVGKRLWAMYRGDRVWGEWYVPAAGSPIDAAAIQKLGRVSNLYYAALLLLAAPAFARGLRRRGPHLLLPAVVLAWTAFFVLILYGTQRFHFPLMPLFAVLAAQTIGSWRASRAATAG